MEIPVTKGRGYNYAVVIKYSPVPNDVGRYGLQDQYRVGSMPVSIMEKLWHPKNHNVEFFFGPRDKSSFVCYFERFRLHLLGVTGKNGNLTGICVQNRIHSKKLFAHAFFHVLSYSIKLLPHDASITNRGEIFSMHYFRNMVGGYALPGGNPGGAVLIPSRISPIRITQDMPNQYRQIRIVNLFVHYHSVSKLIIAQIDQIVPIFRVMINNLVSSTKFFIQPVTENSPVFFSGIFPV